MTLLKILGGAISSGTYLGVIPHNSVSCPDLIVLPNLPNFYFCSDESYVHVHFKTKRYY